MGTRKLYDYIDGNPAFSFHPTEYVNDSYVISRQYRQVAINVALEVDLTGQVCADSLGTQFYSGIGGQVDFNRGAATVSRRKGDYRPPLHRKERLRLPHRNPAQSRRGGCHDARRCSLRRHGVRCRLPAREECAGKGHCAHLHRASGFPASVAEGGRRGQVSAAGPGPDRRQTGGRPTRLPDHPRARGRHADQFQVHSSNRRTAHCATCSTRCRRRRSTTASCPT